MLEQIKQMMGINNDEFDAIINNYIGAAKLDLEATGIEKGKIEANDNLISSAIISYVLSYLDIPNAELYANAYSLQKDSLRHYGEYKAQCNIPK